MTTSIFTVWCNQEFPEGALELLRNGLGPHRLVLASMLQQFNFSYKQFDPLLAEADIAFGQPDPDLAMRFARLRWIHLTSAGYTAYDRDDFRMALHERGAILTNSSSVYNEPCALHVLAMMTSLSRQLPTALNSQRSARSWSQEVIRFKATLLAGQTVLILGFGAIARRLVELLSPLHMNLIGVRRQVKGDEPIRVVTESELDQYLPIADHLVNILPTNATTNMFLNAARLSAMKPGAIIYNIGRGTTVDQKALLSALQSGHLAAAYLDVTDPEPLPPDHPLWRAPNCYITPHIAGGHSDEMERLVHHFLDNFERFISGHSLIDRVM